MEYYMGEKAELPRSMGPGESPLPLTAPPTAYGAAGRQRSVEMGNPRMTYSNKEVMVQPIHQTAPRGVDNLDIYPPGQVPLGNFRVPSMAQTNTTESTEGTWRTWNVDQRQTSRGKKPWKERFLG